MKITGITVERLRLPLDPPYAPAWEPDPLQEFEAVLVRVQTDEGLTGVGSSGGSGSGPGSGRPGSGSDAGAMDGFDDHRHLFLGTDPLDIVNQVRVIETVTHGWRYWALEAALWDVIGKAAGLPVSALFGNAHKRLPAYASTAELRAPADRAESALAAKERGFKAMKIRFGRGRIHEGIETVRRTRAAVGDDFDLLVDLNRSPRTAGDIGHAMDLVRTRKIVAELADLGVFWVEEPLPHSDVPGLKRLRADVGGTRIAGGQRSHSVPELLRYLELDALDVYQMDVVQAVGMLRARTIAELALLKHRHFTPHAWTNGIGLLANLHVAAGVGGGPYFEFPYDPPGWTPERRDFMLAEPVDVDADGCLTVPQTPGLGVALDEDAVARWRVG